MASIQRHSLTEKLKSICGLLALFAAIAACSGQSIRDPDNDEKKEKARPFKATEPTKDNLNEVTGDREDWRFWVPDKNGKGEVRVEVSKWEDSSTLQAMVTVFDEAGTQLAQKPMNQANPTVREQFAVEGGRKYYARFKLVSGKGEYIAEMSEPLDPCASCTEKQECQDGKCVDKPCGGPCPEGLTCNREKNECVKLKSKPENLCEGVTCPKGEVCVRSSGKCVVPQAPKPDAGEPSGPATIDCDVFEAQDSGTGSILKLSAGENRGVKKGMGGVVKGVKGASFTITEVYPTRSKANCKVPAAKVPSGSKATIKP